MLKSILRENVPIIIFLVNCIRSSYELLSYNGTDGIDGINPSPMAGAMADISTYDRCLQKKIDAHTYLANNDSYHFFKEVGGHILTGHTGTNVGDIILLIVR